MGGAVRTMSKLIVLELNEVPFRVIDEFCARMPESALARILELSDQYITYTEDEIQLDPWISWPSLHRGVNDAKHHILHLGQSTEEQDRKYPPIWKLLKSANMGVGVFGSLHSSMEKIDLRTYKFFLPDFFAPTSFAYPGRLASLQDFNLKMTRESARNVSKSVPMREAANFALGAPFLGVSIDTGARIVRQFASEFGDKRKRARRRNIQCLLLGDVFLAEVRRAKPDYASFYSNHVAAAMHRYWAAAFPDAQIGPSLDPDWLEAYCDEILESMKSFDAVLKKFVRFQAQNPDYRIVIASSLGQSAIPAEHADAYLTITDLKRFMRALGVPDDAWAAAPAMAPDFAIHIHPDYLDCAVTSLRRFSIDGENMLEQPHRMTHAEMRETNGIAYIRHETPVGEHFKPAMAFDVRDNRSVHISFQWDDYDGPMSALIGNREAPFAEIGVGFIAHQDRVNCTAQHCAEGSLIVYPHMNGASRKVISTLDFAPSVLYNFGLTAPDYMKGSPSIAFSPHLRAGAGTQKETKKRPSANCVSTQYAAAQVFPAQDRKAP
jgi:hypothetical protein